MSGEHFNTSCPTCAKRWASHEPGLCAACLIAACEGRDEVFGDRIAKLEADLAAARWENERLRAREQELLEDATRQVELRRSQDRQAMVRRFFHIANQAQPRTPTVPDDETVRFRLRLVAEEFCELLEACFLCKTKTGSDYLFIRKHLLDIIEHNPIKVAMADLIDATIDLDFVSEGFRVACGVDSTTLWEDVSECNAAKLGGPRRARDGKQLKPAGWKPPRTTELLRAQGWRES